MHAPRLHEGLSLRQHLGSDISIRPANEGQNIAAGASSGLLDTAAGDASRNRTVGLRIGKGEKLEDIIKSTNTVAEGVLTSRYCASNAQNALTASMCRTNLVLHILAHHELGNVIFIIIIIIVIVIVVVVVVIISSIIVITTI